MSQWESTMSALGDGIMNYTMNGEQPPRAGNRVQQMAPHGVFRCAPEPPPMEGFPPDDRWISIAVATDDEWRALAGAMGRPELVEDSRFRTLDDRKANEDALEAEVEAWTITQKASDAEHTLQTAGVAAFRPMMNKELAEDPHLKVRSFWVEKEHQAVGVKQHAGIPWKLSETPAEVWRAAPVMGQDNDYVFGELLGMSSDQIADLVAQEVIH
jgi:benzylsuccinate CoA-transferase BbsF subunit